MKEIYVNLSNSNFNKLHPILKNFYKKLEKNYKVNYINELKEEINKEVPTIQKRKWLSLIKYKIFWLANSVIPRLNIIKQQYDWIILTANNFLITKNDYYIITSSLIQFSWLKTKPLYNPIFKVLFKKLLLQKSLKKIYFYSQTAKEEFIRYCDIQLKLNKNKYLDKLDVYYPELLNDKVITKAEIQEKLKTSGKIKFLFIARLFLCKWWLELIQSLKQIYKNNKDIINKFEVNIISDIPENYKKELLELKEKWFNINLYWIQFTQEELEEKFYKTTHILLHLTRADLFWMVSLESKKNGLAVITTKQYVNKELFKENEALFVKIKDKYIWNDWLPKIDYQTIWNMKDEVLDVNDIVENISYLINNKEKILELAYNNLDSLKRFDNWKKMEELF